MTTELRFALDHEPQLDLDLRAHFNMTLQDFFDLDIVTGAVAANRLVQDTSTMLGALVEGLKYPIALHDMITMVSMARVFNALSPEGAAPLEVPLPFEEKKSEPVRERVSAEELARLNELLESVSALPRAGG